MSVSLVAKVDATAATIDWDVVNRRALRIRAGPSSLTISSLGAIQNGRHNLIRLIYFSDATIWVVRVPLLQHAGERTPQEVASVGEMLDSAAATLRYIRSTTSVPVPEVHWWAPGPDGDGAGLPYMMLSFISGSCLDSLWNAMWPRQRISAYRQILHIYREIYQKCRTDAAGSLWMLYWSGYVHHYEEPQWCLGRLPATTSITTAEEEESAYGPFYGAIEFRVASMNTRLAALREDQEQTRTTIEQFATLWCLRSFLPALYDPVTAPGGFFLLPKDFGLKNIMVVLINEEEVVLSGVIDWDWSHSVPATEFLRLPDFMSVIPMLELAPGIQLCGSKTAPDRILNLIRNEEGQSFSGFHKAAFGSSDKTLTRQSLISTLKTIMALENGEPETAFLVNLRRTLHELIVEDEKATKTTVRAKGKRAFQSMFNNVRGLLEVEWKGSERRRGARSRWRRSPVLS